GEKSMFGLGKEIMKTEKKPTKNVVISERDYKNLVTAVRDNDKLKQHVSNLMITDMASEYKKLSKEHGQVKEKYRNRKSTRLNSSHVSISYAVFCLKKKSKHRED